MARSDPTRRYRMNRHARGTAARLAGLSFAVPTVVALRTSRMLAAGATPSAADRREMHRMTSEKVRAFSASYYAMAARWQRMQIESWLALTRFAFDACTRPWWIATSATRARGASRRRVERAWHDIVDAGLAPLHRTATANARRLSRRR
jgi:hypothetical protein